jgi:hypothetical protein
MTEESAKAGNRASRFPRNPEGTLSARKRPLKTSTSTIQGMGEVCAAEAYDIFFRTYNASVLAHFVKLSERLGVTIVDRKRARVELADPEPTDKDEEAADAAVIDWHKRLGHHGLHTVPDPDPPGA